MDSEICHVMLVGHIYTLFVLSCFGHCCKTIFLHLSLMEAQSQFPAQTGMQACSWPFHTTKSWNGPRQSDGCSSTLSSAYLWSLPVNSSHSTTRHACLTRVCSLWAARGENVFRLFCFFGALLLECMQTQEKRSGVVHQWEIETDSYILFDCKDLQHSDQLLAQIFTAVTLRNNLIDWLNYLFKIPLLFPFNKDV